MNIYNRLKAQQPGASSSRVSPTLRKQQSEGVAPMAAAASARTARMGLTQGKECPHCSRQFGAKTLDYHI